MVKWIVLSVVLTTACSAITGFNRSSAADLIEKDKRYVAVSTMTIDIRGRLANASADIAQKSVDETAEQAIPRAKDDFMQRHPQLLVAENLGYIKLYFENGELGDRPMGAPRFDDNLKHWFYRPRAEITDEGRKLWTNLNQQVDEEALPIAVRGEPQITGMKDENKTTKSSDFTFYWEPTPLGEAFDPESSKFKQLPENLQRALNNVQQNIFGGGSNNLAKFKTARKGRAFFQQYDDGWRISNIAFF